MGQLCTCFIQGETTKFTRANNGKKRHLLSLSVVLKKMQMDLSSPSPYPHKLIENLRAANRGVAIFNPNPIGRN